MIPLFLLSKGIGSGEDELGNSPSSAKIRIQRGMFPLLDFFLITSLSQQLHRQFNAAIVEHWKLTLDFFKNPLLDFRRKRLNVTQGFQPRTLP